MSLIAILSISLTVNLPGLAITPVIGKIKEVFYPVSELEVELLSSLPNLVIIPKYYGQGVCHCITVK